MQPKVAIKQRSNTVPQQAPLPPMSSFPSSANRGRPTLKYPMTLTSLLSLRMVEDVEEEEDEDKENMLLF